MTQGPSRGAVAVWVALAAFLLWSPLPSAGVDAGGDLSEAPAVAGGAGEWIAARRDYSWSFPRDHWSHPGYRTEWWYLTGHLESETDPSRRFGYQFTLFRVGLLTETPPLVSSWAATDVIMGHAAVTDLAAGVHTFSEVLWRAGPLLGEFEPFPAAGAVESLPIAWCRAPAGTDTTWYLAWNGAAFSFAMRDDAQRIAYDLSTSPARPLVLHGPNGYSRKGTAGDAASQYYSFTRLATRGTITVGGTTHVVRGMSWMDKEFGSGVLGPHQEGWDWFSLQFDDGRDVMLYLLRDRQGGIDFARGTLVGVGGAAQELGPEEFAVESSRTWESPVTGASYPARWTVRVPAASPPIAVEVVPELAGQENRGRLAGGLFYWEGAVLVQDERGGRIGQGYVELTGYGTGNRPGL